MSFSRVFLVGFMCSGKTTVGSLLAQRLRWRFRDTDEEVERREGMSIAELFQKKGERHFRLQERLVLAELLEEDRVVVSTGGGLGANLEAMELMKAKGLVVWLRVGFETFLQRCGSDPSRPLLKRDERELRELFEERAQVYGRAHLTLDGSLPADLLVEEFIVPKVLEDYNIKA